MDTRGRTSTIEINFLSPINRSEPSLPLSSITNRKSNPLGDTVLYNIEQQQDYMPTVDKDDLENDSAFLSNLEPDERIIYSSQIVKINYKQVRQVRVLCLTNRHLYSLRPNTYGNTKFMSFFNKKWRVRIVIP